MTTKTLFKKLENAREIAELTGDKADFRIFCEIDGLDLNKQLEYSSTIWFRNWKEFIKAVKAEWSVRIVDIVNNGELVSECVDGFLNKEVFHIDNEDNIEIRIGVWC